MANVVYEIDPAADTVIILKNSSTAFAVWDTLEVQENTDALYPDRETVNTLPVYPTPLGSDIEESTVDTVEQLAAGESTFDTTEEPVMEEPAGHATSIVENTIEPDLSECSTNKKEIHYYVSSRHLTLASSRFDSMLTKGKWTEGVPDSNDGRYHISAEDWDVEALLLLLNVLHHRNRQVPRSLSLEMLAKIAVLIDYYDCAEAVELCIERWIEHIRKTSPVPSGFCRDLILWMCIAWVLRMPNEFTQTTAIAVRQVERELLTLGLPITACVERVDQVRLQAISTVVSRLQDLLDEYSNPTYQCPNDYHSFECGSILYGALSIQLKSVGLLVDPPMASYCGLEFWKTYKKLQNIKSPVWYDSRSHKMKGKRLPDPHPCNLRARVDNIMAEVIHLADGFNLRDFGRA